MDKRAVQEAVTAAAHLLRGIQTTSTSFPSHVIRLQSRGAHLLQRTAAGAQRNAPAVGVAAAQGLLKCLPYELPSLTAQCSDLETAAPLAAGGPRNAVLMTSDGAAATTSMWVHPEHSADIEQC